MPIFRIRVKAKTRVIGIGVPHDARPGDLLVGNRGSMSLVNEDRGILFLDYAGHCRAGVMPVTPPNIRVYDFR